MFVVGLILLLAAAGVAADLIVQNAHTLHVNFFNATVSNASISAAVVAGLVLAAIGALGLLFMISGGARSRRRRLAHREQLALRDEESARAGAERDQLAAELEKEQQARRRAEAESGVPVAGSAGSAGEQPAVGDGPVQPAVDREAAGRGRHSLLGRRGSRT
ncbi:MAG TPA: hypothetical protein VGN54_13075 [Mycobacteriales bacterium]|jgi:hypothetical protein|nr:hypothetical protein [Mycobacteriales bacterium]